MAVVLDGLEYLSYMLWIVINFSDLLIYFLIGVAFAYVTIFTYIVANEKLQLAGCEKFLKWGLSFAIVQLALMSIQEFVEVDKLERDAVIQMFISKHLSAHCCVSFSILTLTCLIVSQQYFEYSSIFCGYWVFVWIGVCVIEWWIEGCLSLWFGYKENQKRYKNIA